MSTERNKERVREWFEVFNTGHFSGVAALHAEECRNHAPAPFDTTLWPSDGRPFGVEEFRGTVEWIRRSQPDLHVEIERMLAEGDEVIAWIRASGTATGAAGPIPPTGASIEFAQAHRFRFVNDRIVEHWAVRDDLRSMIQARVITARAGRPQ